MVRFTLHRTSIKGLTLLERNPLIDNRGFFERFFCSDDLQSLLKNKTIHQINRTQTNRKGTIRGMHFQYPPHAEKKLVSCIHGSIYDVAVDIRSQSPTFMPWHGAFLSGQNLKTLMQTKEFDAYLSFFKSNY